MSLHQLQSRLRQLEAHYGAQKAGKTGALGQMHEDVVKEDWISNIVSNYRGKDKSSFADLLDRTFDRETKMGIEKTSETLHELGARRRI